MTTNSKKQLPKHTLLLAGKRALCLYACLFPASLAWAQATTIEERFQQATEAMREGHLEEAGESFASIAKDSPNFAEAYLNLGLVREELGRNEEARESFRKALTIKPRLRGANLFLAVAEYRLNHFKDAIAALKKETAYYPSDPNAWMWLGVVLLAAENPEEAAAALDKAAKL
jgi:Flp pilus assembly protein TadD